MSNDVKKIFIAGFGGQGVLLIGQMLSYAAMYEDKEVTWMPSYGPEMRGGTANCTVCIGSEPIASPYITDAFDVLIVMNSPSLVKFESQLKPGGDLFINTSCNELAIEKVGNGKTANMVMLGAIIRQAKVVDLNTMNKVFEKVLTGKKAKLIPSNLEALSAWEIGA